MANYEISKCVCPSQWKWLTITKTQAYFAKELITSVTSFKVQATGVNVIKLFWHKILTYFCKLDHFIKKQYFYLPWQDLAYRKEWVNIGQKFYEINSRMYVAAGQIITSWVSGKLASFSRQKNLLTILWNGPPYSWFTGCTY